MLKEYDKDYNKEIDKLEEKDILEAEKKEQQRQLEEKTKTFMCTMGYNFEGYAIEEYLDIVHSEIVLGTGINPEFAASVSYHLSTTSSLFESSLSQAKESVKNQLVVKSISKGANAVIGLDFDVHLLNNNVFLVSSNGTAVRIKKL